uniref:Uncharacterized protein n=1 Tax=Anabas testudineus TaxID=64144 RepID=A0AAQ6IEM4_ANATE
DSWSTQTDCGHRELKERPGTGGFGNITRCHLYSEIAPSFLSTNSDFICIG